jgi:hypothetical protein
MSDECPVCDSEYLHRTNAPMGTFSIQNDGDTVCMTTNEDPPLTVYIHSEQTLDPIEE